MIDLAVGGFVRCRGQNRFRYGDVLLVLTPLGMDIVREFVPEPLRRKPHGICANDFRVEAVFDGFEFPYDTLDRQGTLLVEQQAGYAIYDGLGGATFAEGQYGCAARLCLDGRDAKILLRG